MSKSLPYVSKRSFPGAHSYLFARTDHIWITQSRSRDPRESRWYGSEKLREPHILHWILDSFPSSPALTSLPLFIYLHLGLFRIIYHNEMPPGMVDPPLEEASNNFMNFPPSEPGTPTMFPQDFIIPSPAPSRPTTPTSLRGIQARALIPNRIDNPSSFPAYQTLAGPGSVSPISPTFPFSSTPSSFSSLGGNNNSDTSPGKRSRSRSSENDLTMAADDKKIKSEDGSIIGVKNMRSRSPSPTFPLAPHPFLHPSRSPSPAPSSSSSHQQHQRISSYAGPSQPRLRSLHEYSMEHPPCTSLFQLPQRTFFLPYHSSSSESTHTAQGIQTIIHTSAHSHDDYLLPHPGLENQGVWVDSKGNVFLDREGLLGEIDRDGQFRGITREEIYEQFGEVLIDHEDLMATR